MKGKINLDESILPFEDYTVGWNLTRKLLMLDTDEDEQDARIDKIFAQLTRNIEEDILPKYSQGGLDCIDLFDETGEIPDEREV